jgi:hypothetical protein
VLEKTGSAGKCAAGYFRKSRKNVTEKVKLLNRALEKVGSAVKCTAEDDKKC